MNIKLVQTGGLLPITKEASADIDWSDAEFENLLNVIGLEEDPNSSVRDAVYTILEGNGRSVWIDLSKLPAKYKSTFANLTANFTIVKL
jgi:hypothetical protein